MSVRRALLLACVPILLAGLAAHAQSRKPDPKNGRAVAQKHCSRCHVIGSYNKSGGISSTPSFQLLVNAFKDYEERFLTFFERRPHPVFIRVLGFRTPYPLPPSAKPIQLELDAIEDMLAFAKTLRKKKKRP